MTYSVIMGDLARQRGAMAYRYLMYSSTFEQRVQYLLVWPGV